MNNESITKAKIDLALKILVPVLLICVVVGIWVVKNEQKNTVLEIDNQSIVESGKPSIASTDKQSTVESQPTSTTLTDKSNTVESGNSSIASTDKSSTVESENSRIASKGKSSTVESQKSSEASKDNPSVTTSDKRSKGESKEPIVGSNVAESDSLDFNLDVTEKIDLEKLKSYGLPIIIDFGADTCVPCKEMAPVLKELNAELRGKAIIKFVDVWKYRDLAEGYPISLIPTQVLIDLNGKPYSPKDPEAIKLKLYSSRGTEEHVFTTHEGGITKEQLLSILKEMGLK